MLTKEKIQELAGLPKVRRIAVENFLGSMPMKNPKWAAMENLKMDARLYGWNKETVAAITKGINQAYK